MHIGRSAALAVLAGIAFAPSRSVRMFPQLILLRAPGSSEVVVLGHTGTDGWDVRNDTLVLLYSGLTPVHPKDPAAVRRRPGIDVAEFFDAGAWKYYDANRHIPRPPPFDAANHHSRIYMAGDADSPAVWESPVVAAGGVHDTFYAVDSRAEAMLRARGIRLRARP